MFLGFLGTQYLSIDAKGRLALPTRHRDALNGKVVATVDTRAKCLVLYPIEQWHVVAQKVQALSSMNPKNKRFQRLFFGYANDLDIDANGRILLPANLREYAGLEKRVALVGQGLKMELWSEAMWAAESEDFDLLGDDLPDDLADLVL